MSYVGHTGVTNGGDYALRDANYYFGAGGDKVSPTWSAATTYAIRVSVVYGGAYWTSLQANNLNHTPVEGAWWTAAQRRFVVPYTGVLVSSEAYLKRGATARDVKQAVYSCGALVGEATRLGQVGATAVGATYNWIGGATDANPIIAANTILLLAFSPSGYNAGNGVNAYLIEANYAAQELTIEDVDGNYATAMPATINPDGIDTETWYDSSYSTRIGILYTPSSLTATRNGAQIDLAWATPADTLRTGYDIYRNENGAGYAAFSTPALDATTASDATVVTGHVYQYEIRAKTATVNGTFLASGQVTMGGAGLLTLGVG